jgi:hypothetical protein
MMKIEGSASGSISQRHGSADPDPDPHQNVMDPQHWTKGALNQHFIQFHFKQYANLKINFSEDNLCLEPRSVHKSSVTIVTGVSADLQVGLHVASQLVLALKHLRTARTGKGALRSLRVGELVLTQGRRLHEGLAAEPADLLAARGAGGVLQAVALQLVLGEGHKVAGLAYRVPGGVWVGLTRDRRGVHRRGK